MRGTEEQREIGGSMRHGKKKEREAVGEKQRECATVRMKIYKYVRFKRGLGDGELRKERKR